jgi:hypothetical protein
MKSLLSSEGGKLYAYVVVATIVFVIVATIVLVIVYILDSQLLHCNKE